MKRINYTEDFKTADGQPFTIVDPDIMVQREVRKAAEVAGLDKWPAPTIDCTFAQAIIWFVNSIPFSDEADANGNVRPPRRLTLEDAGNAYAVIKAFLNVQKGFVDMEDAVYLWLLETVKLDGIEAFRPVATQAIVRERLEDLVKP